MKARGGCSKMLWNATEDREGEKTSDECKTMAAVEEIDVDATAATVLWELDGSFTLKEEQKNSIKGFSW